MLAPSTKNSTWATPLVASAALAVMSIAPETVAPATGLVMLTVGSVLSTVTLTLSLSVCPRVSVAVAISVYPPATTRVASQEAEYGSVVSTPMEPPSTKNSTCVTP